MTHPQNGQTGRPRNPVPITQVIDFRSDDVAPVTDRVMRVAARRRRATMRRAGFLISKMRYQAIQIRTPMQAGLSLDLARHSSRCVGILRRLESAPGIISVHNSESNVLLVEFSESVRAAFAGSANL